MPAAALRRCVLALLAACGVAAAGALDPVPRFDDVKAAHRPSDLLLLGRHGLPLQSLRVDHRERRLEWVTLPEMSPALRAAVVQSEDREFWTHAGIDWAAVAGSAFGNLLDSRTRGASTLTMQLAGLIDADLSRPARGRSMPAKLGQAVVATRLEREWSKQQILEAYLNLVPWRGETVGIAALSHTLFGKWPSGLDAQESAIAAVLLRAPNADAAQVSRRACQLLTLQQRDCMGVEALVFTAFARRPLPSLQAEPLAPHFARQALAAAGEVDTRHALRTTVDASVQRFAIATLRRQLAELSGRNVEDGAVLVLDNASGEVLAWVGSSGPVSSRAAAVDAVLARRQPGSTLKPFVYALALERRLITPASLLDDAPLALPASGGAYRPRNYDDGHQGLVSARTALGSSLNVPAMRVGALLGADALAERLNRFGLALRESGGYYGNSLALGGAEVDLLSLTNAYRALARSGQWSAPRLLPGGPPGAARRAAEASAVFQVVDILADNGARARSFGLDSPLLTRGFAAVKTGTSKDLRDNWCVGFTDRYTVGVWVGNASGEPMHVVSGATGAAPVWRAMVEYLHADRPSRPPAPPPGLQRVRVEFDRGIEPARDEWLVAATSTQPTARVAVRAAPGVAQGIRSPLDGSVYALDPDIPLQAQRIRFEGDGARWQLDGRPLAGGAKVWWTPRPGRHALSLMGADGHARATVRFEVR